MRELLLTYEDAIFDWMDDIPEFDDDFYAGFEDGTEVIEWLDKNEDFRIKIEDMAGDEIGNILDRFNEKIEEAKDRDEPTIFIRTEDQDRFKQESEEIDLTPDESIFFEKPAIKKQIEILQNELEITRKELQDLEFEEEFEEQFEMEEDETDKIPVSLFKRVRNFFGF